ncbi:CHASE2 domain-containing protein [Marinospirillum perlucidum]|uniref:CHASE2 domain-containing protein n=1 Tax=Marinospirillum perlucidum TaxID=1982602 RepID=UPI001C4984E9|nr:adenylate/guanylate cyclase domain-containing protein [Marinospirillum perlucidum]
MLNPVTSRRLASLLGLLLGAFLMLAQSGWLPLLDRLYERLELLTYDFRMQLHLPASPGTATTPIVIVDIDEESLKREGHWPWSRSKIAELIKAMDAAGAVIIGFDVLFAEAERNPVEAIQQQLDSTAPALSQDFRSQLQALAPRYDGDRLLAQTLADHEVVLGYIFSHQNPSHSGTLPSALNLQNPGRIENLALPSMAGYTAPLPQLAEAAIGSGFFSLATDSDGVVRRAPLVTRYEDQLYPSLSLEMVRQYLLIERLQLHTERVGGEEQLDSLELGGSLRLPTDGSGQLLIPFRGGAGSFPYVPAWKLLAGKVEDSPLSGALVLVGTTAPGLFDLRATPVDSVYPGVEVHANLIAAMLDEQFLTEPSWAVGANWLLAGSTGLLLALLLPWLSPWGQVVSALLSALAVTLLVSWLWAVEGIVLALAIPLLMILLLAVFNFTWGFFVETVNRRRLVNMFGQYVPPSLVEEMSQHPDAFSFEGRSRELTVLFSDIRGFTALSENLEANQLKHLLNRYFTPITRDIFQHRGTIDKYIGDLVMAFWGAPLKDAEHAVNAIKAGLQILDTTRELNQTFIAEGWPQIEVGIGINSGLMNVGDMGSEYRRSYTVLGDAVNLGSRLEGATKYYQVPLVVGQRTQELAAEHFLWRELDLVRVKGKRDLVRVYQPLCLRSEATSQQEAEIEALDQALIYFRSARLQEARKAFARLAKEQPQIRLYALYLERLDLLEDQPPAPDWDGGWSLQEK